MLNTFIVIFSMFGLAFLIKESDGPFDIMSRLRNLLMRNKYVGVFFFKLLDCYFCTGFHTGWIIYLLHEKNWHLNLLFCWGLAGGAVSLMMDAALSSLKK